MAIAVNNWNTNRLIKIEVDNYKQTHYQLLFDQTINDFLNLNIAGNYTSGKGYFEQFTS